MRKGIIITLLVSIILNVILVFKCFFNSIDLNNVDILKKDIESNIQLLNDSIKKEKDKSYYLQNQIELLKLNIDNRKSVIVKTKDRYVKEKNTIIQLDADKSIEFLATKLSKEVSN